MVQEHCNNTESHFNNLPNILGTVLWVEAWPWSRIIFHMDIYPATSRVVLITIQLNHSQYFASLSCLSSKDCGAFLRIMEKWNFTVPTWSTFSFSTAPVCPCLPLASVIRHSYPAFSFYFSMPNFCVDIIHCNSVIFNKCIARPKGERLPPLWTSPRGLQKVTQVPSMQLSPLKLPVQAIQLVQV